MALWADEGGVAAARPATVQRRKRKNRNMDVLQAPSLVAGSALNAAQTSLERGGLWSPTSFAAVHKCKRAPRTHSNFAGFSTPNVVDFGTLRVAPDDSSRFVRSLGLPLRELRTNVFGKLLVVCLG